MLPLPATGPQVKQEQQNWRHQRRGQDDHQKGKHQHMPQHLQAQTDKDMKRLSTWVRSGLRCGTKGVLGARPTAVTSTGHQAKVENIVHEC